MDAVIFATGFAQPAKLSNGMARILEEIADDILCELYSWREYERIPDIVARAAKYDRLVLVGHSWGGWFCNELANAFDGVLPIADMLLADPVTRPPGGALCVPTNVKRLHVWRKRSGIIPTAEITTGEGTRFVTNATVDVNHNRVDDLPAFQAAVVKAAKGE